MTKSGLMVGLGETHEEMVETFAALREHGVQVLTVGQYLRPSERHLPVVRYWHPDEFAALERAAYELGFEHVAAGPLVRSSYHADQHVPQARARGARAAICAPSAGEPRRPPLPCVLAPMTPSARRRSRMTAPGRARRAAALHRRASPSSRSARSPNRASRWAAVVSVLVVVAALIGIVGVVGALRNPPRR